MTTPFNGDFARWEPDCKESVQNLANDIGAELARLRQENQRLIDEAGKRIDDCAMMTGQIQYLREQNRRLRHLIEAMNHMGGDERGGFCICSTHDGSAPDMDHSTVCADFRAALAEKGQQP